MRSIVGFQLHKKYGNDKITSFPKEKSRMIFFLLHCWKISGEMCNHFSSPRVTTLAHILIKKDFSFSDVIHGSGQHTNRMQKVVENLGIFPHCLIRRKEENNVNP